MSMQLADNAMAQGCVADEYENVFWPQLRGALDTVLLKPPGSYHPISYEQVRQQRHANRAQFQLFPDCRCIVPCINVSVSIKPNDFMPTSFATSKSY